jgi:hypothetical protein
MKKPRYEKKKTRPYLLTGLKTGMDFAFFEIGLISGALQSCFNSNPMLVIWGSADNLCEQSAVERPGSLPRVVMEVESCVFLQQNR